jgi:undecaprenyl-diphosphatase
MTLLHAIFLGIIQGITEFLPVSSSAHLMVFSKLMGLPEQRLSFDVFLNIGTFLAIFVFFWPKIWSLIRGSKDLLMNKKTEDRNFLLILIASSIPTIIVFGFAEIFLDIDFKTNVILSIALVVFAIILWFCDRQPMENKTITMKDGIFVGCAQILSIIPGVSRLGICLSMMRYLHYSREESFKFSIILSIPPVAGACLLKLINCFSGKTPIDNWLFVFIGCIFSFVFGLMSLTTVNIFLKKYTLLSVIIYRIIFAIFIAVRFSIF